jgi:hypothetical protein
MSIEPGMTGGAEMAPQNTGTKRDRLVGVRSDSFSFLVEISKVREFARAVLDPFAEMSVPPVPPTFPMYGVADFERRFFFDVLGLDRARTLNAGQEYYYHRPLRVGDVVHCEAVVTDEYTKSGRRGELRFIVIETSMRGGDGEPILTSTATVVETSAPPQGGAS